MDLQILSAHFQFGWWVLFSLYFHLVWSYAICNEYTVSAVWIILIQYHIDFELVTFYSYHLTATHFFPCEMNEFNFLRISRNCGTVSEQSFSGIFQSKCVLHAKIAEMWWKMRMKCKFMYEKPKKRKQFSKKKKLTLIRMRPVWIEWIRLRKQNSEKCRDNKISTTFSHVLADWFIDLQPRNGLKWTRWVQYALWNNLLKCERQISTKRGIRRNWFGFLTLMALKVFKCMIDSH